jgi:hypothetical protein
VRCSYQSNEASDGALAAPEILFAIHLQQLSILKHKTLYSTQLRHISATEQDTTRAAASIPRECRGGGGGGGGECGLLSLAPREDTPALHHDYLRNKPILNPQRNYRSKAQPTSARLALDKPREHEKRYR